MTKEQKKIIDQIRNDCIAEMNKKTFIHLDAAKMYALNVLRQPTDKNLKDIANRHMIMHDERIAMYNDIINDVTRAIDQIEVLFKQD